MLTVAHAVEESSQCTQVLSCTAEVEQVRVDTLKLVHDSTDIVDTVAELNAHTLLYHANKSVAVHHSREIVQAVGQGESLRIGHALPHLLDAAVDIAQVRIDALHLLAVENGLQAEHTVCRRVVRADVHNEVGVLEEALLCSYEVAVGVETVHNGVVRLGLVGKRELVCLGAHVEVLAQRIAVEVGTQEQTAHVGVAQELDAYEVVDLALEQLGCLPELYDGRNHVAAVHLLCDGAYRAALVVVGVLKNVDTSQAFLAEVLADDGNKVVEMFLVLQLRHLTCEIVK